MKKFRVLFAAIALVLITAGVFAKTARFTNAGLYAKSTAGVFSQLTNSETFNQDLTLSGSTQAKIISSTSVTYTLWYDDGTGTKVAVYTTGL